ncbi:hypothetical protein [Kitasatospora sp. NBC_00315]|uniref:hypothetical protein n=1 Tax=Kitasatospora sp. NBC_00315 TaxID=2975963 RepID=UPI00324A4DF5
MIEYELIQQRARELQARAEHHRLIAEARAALPGRGRRLPALAAVLGRLGGGVGGGGADQRAARPAEC